MGFFDKVTKAVGSAVDKTKKEADQFMRIQKIKGEIGDMEKKIAGYQAEIQAATLEAGAKAIALVRAGSLSTADVQPFAERIAGLEQQIGAEQAAIGGKRADIEKIKAEDDVVAPHEPPAPPAATVAAPPPPVPAAPADAESPAPDAPVVPPPIPK